MKQLKGRIKIPSDDDDTENYFSINQKEFQIKLDVKIKFYTENSGEFLQDPVLFVQGNASVRNFAALSTLLSNLLR